MLGLILSLSLLFVLPGEVPAKRKPQGPTWRCCVGAPANSRYCR